MQRRRGRFPEVLLISVLWLAAVVIGAVEGAAMGVEMAAGRVAQAPAGSPLDLDVCGLSLSVTTADINPCRARVAWKSIGQIDEEGSVWCGRPPGPGGGGGGNGGEGGGDGGDCVISSGASCKAVLSLFCDGSKVKIGIHCDSCSGSKNEASEIRLKRQPADNPEPETEVAETEEAEPPKEEETTADDGGDVGEPGGKPNGEGEEGGVEPNGEGEEGGVEPNGEGGEGDETPDGEGGEGGVTPDGEGDESGVTADGEGDEGGVTPEGEVGEDGVESGGNGGAADDEGGNGDGENNDEDDVAPTIPIPDGIDGTQYNGDTFETDPIDDQTPEEPWYEQPLLVSLVTLLGVILLAAPGVLFLYWRWRALRLLAASAGALCKKEEPLSRRVAESALETYVVDSLRSGELRHQHAQLLQGCVRPCSVARRPDNRRRNRYNDLLAYDETRVVLKALPKEPPLGYDYINANYIDGYGRPKEFIAAQAPTAATAPDFWRMVWQEGVRVVLTLCSVREAGIEKCFPYWPSAGAACAHGPFAVASVGEEQFPDVIIRHIGVVRAGEQRQVLQLQFTAWPDHGVPHHPEAVSALLRRVERAAAAAGAAGPVGTPPPPVLVHCSAGVGRTGTVILAAAGVAQARVEGAVDLLALLQRMRRQRPNVVDTAEQFELAHQVVVDALLEAPLVLEAGPALGARLRELRATGELRAQWRRLERRAGRSSTLRASRPQGSASHTSLLAPPTTPRISRMGSLRRSFRASALNNGAAQGSESSLGSGTLGAPGPPSGPAPALAAGTLLIDGYKQREQFAAATSRAAAAAALWREAWTRGCRVAVQLQGAPPPVDACLARDVLLLTAPEPSADAPAPADFGPHVQARSLTVCIAAEEWAVRLLRLTSPWEAGADSPAAGARPLLDLWQAAVQSSPGDAPILLFCEDGRRACGLFAALAALLEQLKHEHCCCAAQAVRCVRRSNDMLVCSEEQLLLLYEAAATFLSDFDTYSNFAGGRRT